MDWDAENMTQDTESTNNSAGGKKSSKIGPIICIALVLAALLFCSFVGVRTLIRRANVKEQKIERDIKLEKGTWTKFQAYYATDIFTFTHRVNFVPMGNEYYFMVFSRDFSTFAVVRADKNWCEENFENGTAASQEGVTVEGYVRTPDEKVQSAIAGARRQMVEAAARSFAGETDRYIDLLATRISIYEIIIGIFPIVYVLGLLFLGPKVYRLLAGKPAGKIVGGGVLILALVYIGFAIHVYMMVM
ncbi:MAG: hypothetical protein K6B39_00230 [Lachnospiraceae bacterium]|nr:hypothetical protein [Lachnospiraceae bacterium]